MVVKWLLVTGVGRGEQPDLVAEKFFEKPETVFDQLQTKPDRGYGQPATKKQ